MSRLPHPSTMAAQSRRPGARPGRLLALVGLVLVAALATGCDELSARHLIQEGNKEYGEQNYEKAAEYFQQSIAKHPGIDIAHHNLGITYSRMFKPGIETPENRAFADKAAEQFAIWLKKHPKDSKIQKLLTSLWVDAGEYEKAVAFWKTEHQANPTSREIIQRVAGIYFKSGDWRSSVEWYQKDIDVAPDKEGKIAGYSAIANLTFGLLFSSSAREKLQGVDRTEIAEVGLAAAGEGLKLDDTNIALTGICQGLWLNRAIANGPSWAMAIDRAEAQVFEQRARVLRAEAKKAQDAAADNAGTTPAPASGT
ncbi:MAG: tetratricopeptide repeat protein [Kofleriaceae bacterium]